MTNIHIWTVSVQSTPSMLGNLQDQILQGKPFQFARYPIILTRRADDVHGNWINWQADYAEETGWFTIAGAMV